MTQFIISLLFHTQRWEQEGREPQRTDYTKVNPRLLFASLKNRKQYKTFPPLIFCETDLKQCHFAAVCKSPFKCKGRLENWRGLQCGGKYFKIWKKLLQIFLKILKYSLVLLLIWAKHA